MGSRDTTILPPISRTPLTGLSQRRKFTPEPNLLNNQWVIVSHLNFQEVNATGKSSFASKQAMSCALTLSLLHRESTSSMGVLFRNKSNLSQTLSSQNSLSCSLRLSVELGERVAFLNVLHGLTSYLSFCTSTIPIRNPVSKESISRLCIEMSIFNYIYLNPTFVAPAPDYTNHHHLVRSAPTIHKVISSSIYHV
jgi:hypothetical protein